MLTKLENIVEAYTEGVSRDSQLLVDIAKIVVDENPGVIMVEPTGFLWGLAGQVSAAAAAAASSAAAEAAAAEAAAAAAAAA